MWSRRELVPAKRQADKARRPAQLSHRAMPL
eukprot:CAMPEP_0115557978 /NCGR_PEP_ID=MMETSP0271-20121206/99200_1 /TAXON_ID=71861 /ORGANISM="Scrippsiella trochoidea, Strain CCMP3099" /LENGTH=30 /DNA_ID= /DNA_START= /DNA_END= /DNA_ORIENTATION=